jgi:hypothetical protein
VTPWWDLDRDDRPLTPQERAEAWIALAASLVVCGLALGLWLVG